MTPEQLATLKEYIDADPALAAFPNYIDYAFEIAEILNRAADPAFFIWRPAVDISDIMGNGFDWESVKGLNTGNARVWEWMSAQGSIKPNQANVRLGIAKAFEGPQLITMRTAVFGHCQRLASRFEKLFAIGAGTTTNDAAVGPATAALYGPLSPYDVDKARHL